MHGYKTGTKVKWNWGNGTGTGTITERFTEDVSRRIKGATVKRTATASEPAYLIEQDDGDRVLKGHGEVERA